MDWIASTREEQNIQVVDGFIVFSFLLERDESRGDFLKKSNENVYIAVRRNIYFFLSFFFDLNENERQ